MSDSAPAPANAADKIVIRFAHSNTPSDMDPYHALVTKMSDKLVKKLGADRIEIQEFPAGQIGSEERSFQDVQQGILQMTVLAVNNASIFAPSLGAFDLPYIFKSVKEFDDCVDQNWDLINKRMEAESGTVAIAWHSQGFRFITNSKQPVAKLADLESREVLLAKAAGVLKAVMYQAAYVINAPASKAVRTVDALRAKQEEAAA